MILSAIATVFLVAVSATSAVASSEDNSEREIKPDRVIFIDRPAPRLPDAVPLNRSLSTATMEVRTSAMVEFPVQPEPGETVRVIYSDAVTDVIASAAGSCTESMTSYTPYKSGNQARVNGSFMRSTGCSASKGARVALYRSTLQAKRDSTVSNNGYTVSWGIGKDCYANDNASWSGKSIWISGGATSGPSATLPCRLF